MYRFISGFLLTALFLTSSVGSHAQDVPRLDMRNSGEAGHVPVIRRPVSVNNTERIDVEKPSSAYTQGDDDASNLDINRVYTAMGCAALDTQEARKSTLNIGEENIDELYATSLGRYMTTTLFANPQNVAVFQGLESFSGARVQELQDRCAAVEYKDDLAPAQWEAVQACIQKQSASAFANGASTEKEALAFAFKACLSSPDYTPKPTDADMVYHDNSSSVFLEMEELLQGDKWAGTLYSALSKTSACMRGGAYKYCNVLSFIPNFRWCTGTNKSGHDECSESNGDIMDLGNPSGDSRVVMSPEAVSPMQIFEMSMGLSEHFVNYAMTYAEGLLKTYSMKTVEALVGPGENLNAKYYTNSLSTRADVLAGNQGDVDTSSSRKFSDAVTPRSEIAQYLNCSAYNASTGQTTYGVSGLIPEWENFDEITGLDSDANPNLPKPIPLDSRVSGDYVTSGPDFSDEKLLDQDYLASMIADPLSDPDASYIDTILVQTVTMCVMRHDLRLSLSDYITLVGRKDIKDAALIGYRRQVAYATTRYLLSYLVDKLRNAQMEWSLMVATDPNLPPPHVRLSLNTVIDSLKEKIERMEQMRKQQTDYAEKIAAFRK